MRILHLEEVWGSHLQQQHNGTPCPFFNFPPPTDMQVASVILHQVVAKCQVYRPLVQECLAKVPLEPALGDNYRSGQQA